MTNSDLERMAWRSIIESLEAASRPVRVLPAPVRFPVDHECWHRGNIVKVLDNWYSPAEKTRLVRVSCPFEPSPPYTIPENELRGFGPRLATSDGTLK